MAKKLKKDTLVAKAKSLKTNVTRKFNTGGTGDPLKKGNIATAADSSFVAEGANAPHNFYKNNGYRVREEARRQDDVTIRNIFKDLEDARKRFPTQDVYFPTDKNRDINTNIPITYDEYTTYKPGQHRFEQREIAIGGMNKQAPMSRYDDRILPQGVQGYSYTMGADYAEVPIYDKLAVTPWKDLTNAQKIKRLQKYGGSGTPYKDKASIKQGIEDLKNPVPQPKMKEASLLPVPKIDLQPQLQNVESPYTPPNRGEYFIQPSGNPGVGVVHYKKDNGDGTYTTRVIGPSLVKDWYNDADQKIFHDKDPDTRVGSRIDYDPRDPDQKIYASMHDAVMDLEKNSTPSIQTQANKKVRGVRKAYAKFDKGGLADLAFKNLTDPEKPVGGPAKDQFFPNYYTANKEVFDKADSEARGMGTDWYSKRKELPQFTKASDVFLKTFNEAAPTHYFPEEAYDKTNYLGSGMLSDASAFTPKFSTEPGKMQNSAEIALHNNPYGSPKYDAGWTKTINEQGQPDNLNANAIYYRGMAGAKPYIAYEELNHIASNIAGNTPETNHAEGMQVLKNTITPRSIRKMGYEDVDRSTAKYYADEEEYLTSLNTARTSLGLDATKNYTEDEIYNILEQGRATGAAGGFGEENAQAEQMSRFYRAIGYPTGNSKFLNGRRPEDLNDEERAKYEQAKRDAVKRFLITHNAVAENKSGNTEDYGLPKVSRYGGYKYENGGPNKKKEPETTHYTVANGKYIFTLPDGTAWDAGSKKRAEDLNTYFNNGWGWTGERTVGGYPAYSRLHEPTSSRQEILPEVNEFIAEPARVEGEYKIEMQTANDGVVVRVHDKNQRFLRWETPDGRIIHIDNSTGSPTSDFDPIYKPKGNKDIQTSGKEQKEKLRKRREAEKKNTLSFEMGGYDDPGKRTKELSTRTKTSDQNYVIKQDMYDEGDYNSVETKTRRSLKGFVTGAPKPKAPFTRKISGEFEEGGMKKNMLNANSTTGPRSEQSWQDPGVDRFSGNTNGVNAEYYLKKGGLKSKVSSKFAKLKI